MSVIEIICNIFMMLGGLAVFMFGMKVMGDNLERVASGKMRQMLGHVTNNRFAGVGVGLGVTALIQSSSATTVMLVGFVNVGILSLTQAAAIIMGANIGTTVTAQISAFAATGDIVTAVMALIACVGVFMMMFSNKDVVRRIGIIMAGLGMLFIGLNLMSSSMGFLAENEAIKGFIQGLKNPFLLLFIGTAFTALIQSSSASTGVIISIAATGLMDIGAAIFFVLGTNIGTCITAMIASVGTTVNARRTAVMHLLFNIIGTIVVFIPLLFLRGPFVKLMVLLSSDTSRQIANFHTIFNVFTTLLLLPFLKGLVWLATKIVRDNEKAGAKKQVPAGLLKHLDERILETPPVAVAQVVNEVIEMSKIAADSLATSIDALFSPDEDKIQAVVEKEKHIDYLNKEITAFLVKVSSLDITARDEKLIGSLYHVVSDIERIGDYAENIIEYAQKMKANNTMFSDDARRDIENIYQKVMLLYRDAMYTFEKKDLNMLPEVARREQEIDELKLEMSGHHIARLTAGTCSPENSAIYLSLASNLERVADHLTNVAYSIKSYTKPIVTVNQPRTYKVNASK